MRGKRSRRTSIWITLAAAWVALAALAQARPQPFADLVTSPAVWRGFQPFVVATGDGDPKRAVRYLRAGNDILRKADVHLELDPATQAFREKAHECMKEFDLKSFLKLLPEQDGAYRYFGFQGTPTEHAYRVRAARGPDFEVHAHGKRRGFGDSSGVVSMRRVHKDDSRRYIVRFRSGVGLGDLAWPSILAGVQDGLAMLDEPDPEGERPLILRTAERYLKKAQPRLGPEDRRILSLLWASFPQVAELLNGIGSAEDVVAGVDPKHGVTRVRAISRWDLAQMERRYPELAAYLEDLDKLMEATIRVDDAHGYRLAELRLDTEHMRSQLSFFVRNGRLVPSRGGRPRPDRRPDFTRMRARANLHFQAMRVHFYIDDLITDVRYSEHGTGATLAGQTRRVPKIRVTGAAFGLFPTRLLDWFIPGDMEGLARSFFEVATSGNDGRGLEWRYRFERSPDGLATLDGRLGMEVLDSALIRFGMAIAADKVVPDEDQLEDIRKLTAAYRDAFDADVARFAKYAPRP